MNPNSILIYPKVDLICLDFLWDGGADYWQCACSLQHTKSNEGRDFI